MSMPAPTEDDFACARRYLAGELRGSFCKLPFTTRRAVKQLRAVADRR
jgi:hypothetical protein